MHSRLVEIKSRLSSRTIIDDLTATTSNRDDNDNDEDGMGDLPGQDFYISTAKLMIECAGQVEGCELARHAVELLSDLLDEDDENIELW